MRIYSMTATFGKLAHETLTLKPGLNIIEAPNEWGKSTWCAFLVAMLYGIDTRERTKGEHLADKEHYAPWSGAPMSGRMDICWNGRDITIERSTKGRSIFGVFRAYETATGLDIPELNAANCGQTLLGVEKSVFTRAGFLKLTDLPVTQDESLRRRLNALVTTGDESGASDILAQKLRDLKNQCRSNRANGLIPKAEAERQELESKLRRISELRDQSQKIHTRQKELEQFIVQLENHQQALAYAAEQETARRAASAQYRAEAADKAVSELTAQCAQLPEAEDLRRRIGRLQQLRDQKESLQMDAQMHPAPPAQPKPPMAFHGCTPEQALIQAKQDKLTYDACQLEQKRGPVWPLIVGVIIAIAGAALLALQYMLPGLILCLLGIGLLVTGVILQNKYKTRAARAQSKADLLLERYRPMPPEQWVASAEDYIRVQEAFAQSDAAHKTVLQNLWQRVDSVQKQLSELTGGLSYLQAEEQWRGWLNTHNALADALREQKQAHEILKTLTGDRPAALPPKFPDDMTFSPAETARLLSDAKFERHQLQLKLGNTQGQTESLGLPEALEQELEAVNRRIAQLEDTYAALEIAQLKLAEATKVLQRRFAPRISRRAQELFGKLTGSRYDRLTLGEDLSLNAGAAGEDILRGSVWRSDGTIDQLYLALRLAVAEELTPEAPLILDDALVRFDDTRLASAMEILAEAGQTKQVILFTCQGREQALLNQ